MNSLTRRRFLRQAAYAGAIAATAGTTALLTRRFARQRTTVAALEKNPFGYDVQSDSKTDPRLVAYHETKRFTVPRADARRVTCGPDGQLYVAAGNYVTVLDSAGATLNEIALPSAARCAAVAIDGFIYIGLRDHIDVFTSKGKRLATWDSVAPRNWFTGIAVGQNDLFVADAGLRVILRYDRSGKLIQRIGEKDSAKNIPGFVVPSPFFDVKLAGDGLLRVTNPGRHRIEAYTTNGDFEFAWGTTGTAIESFCGCCNPISVGLLKDGRYITCEKGLPRVKVYSQDGKLESVVAGPESFAANTHSSESETAAALDAAIDSRGRVFILDLMRNEILVMERKPA